MLTAMARRPYPAAAKGAMHCAHLDGRNLGGGVGPVPQLLRDDADHEVVSWLDGQ
jgi:hypothetical protein